MLSVTDFSYQLPANLIAHQPTKKRTSARLLVFYRQTGKWSHHYFSQLPSLLEKTGKKYLLIYNDSRVIPARLYAQKLTGGKVELLLSKSHQQTTQTQIWECLCKPGLKPHTTLQLAAGLKAQVLSRVSPNSYEHLIQFPLRQRQFYQYLNQYGHTPIPPYIKTNLAEVKLRRVYQTIYARHQGSVAAPTAGLHFSQALWQQLIKAGHTLMPVTLHVGLGTFLGVKTNNLANHQLHREYFHVSARTLAAIEKAHNTKQPILAIGTTSTRVLESLQKKDWLQKQDLVRETQIFLYPPAKFHHTQHLITNFHLPNSSLLMLVAAFTSAPNTPHQFNNWQNSPLGKAYQTAIANNYRFFSFGDAMLIF